MSAVLALLRRRWLTALVGLVLTMAACLFASSHSQPLYQATSQMVFLLPPQPADPELPPVNPYLNFPDGMGATASLIAGIVMTDDVQRELEARGMDAEYSVVLVPAAGPVLDFTVTSTDPDVALQTRDALMDLVDEELAGLQSEASTPANQIMTATRPTVSEQTETIKSPVFRSLALAAGAGLLLLVLLCLVVDQFAPLRRMRERSERAREVAAAAAAAKQRSLLDRHAPDQDRADDQADDGADDGADEESEEIPQTQDAPAGPPPARPARRPGRGPRRPGSEAVPTEQPTVRDDPSTSQALAG